MNTLLNAQIKAISTTTNHSHMGTVIKETKCYVTVCIPNYYGAGRDMVERLYKRDGAMYLDHMFLSFYVVEEEPTAESLVTEKISTVTTGLAELLNDFDGSLHDALQINENCPVVTNFKDLDAVTAYSNYFNDHYKAIQIADINDKLQGLLETEKLDLMYCPCEYVVTNERLVSPRGFNSCDRVFVQTPIAVHMNKTPTASNIPGGFKAHVYHVGQWARDDKA